jgi:hypothetical protein
MPTEDIYYVNDKTIKIIEIEFDLIAKKGWFLLYKNKEDNSLWRLDQ